MNPVEVNTTKVSGTAIWMATPTQESKVGSDLLYFTGLIGGERDNLLADTGVSHYFSPSKVVQLL